MLILGPKLNAHWVLKLSEVSLLLFRKYLCSSPSDISLFCAGHIHVHTVFTSPPRLALFYCVNLLRMKTFVLCFFPISLHFFG